MSPIDVVGSALAMLVGTVALRVSLVRVRTTLEMREVALRAAEELWREANEAGQADGTLHKLHNQMIELAALAPAIAARIVVSRPIELSREDREALEDYLRRNAWCVPYIVTVRLALIRLEFHGRPWSPKLAIDAAIAWCFMRFKSDSRGVVELVNLREAERNVEDLAKFDTRSWNDRTRVPA